MAAKSSGGQIVQQLNLVWTSMTSLSHLNTDTMLIRDEGRFNELRIFINLYKNGLFNCSELLGKGQSIFLYTLQPN